MNRTKLASHMIILGLTTFGVVLAFCFFPSGLVLPKNNFMYFLIAPIVALWIYRITSQAQIRRDLSQGIYKMEDVAKRHDFGMLSHPIYITVILVTWGIFFIYPDMRIMVSVIWMTAIISLWLRLEKGTLENYNEKSEEKENASTP